MINKIHIIHHVSWDTEQITTHCELVMGRKNQLHREALVNNKTQICSVCLEKFIKEIESWKELKKGE